MPAASAATARATAAEFAPRTTSLPPTAAAASGARHAGAGLGIRVEPAHDGSGRDEVGGDPAPASPSPSTATVGGATARG
jgi:hypothetical protein